MQKEDNSLLELFYATIDNVEGYDNCPDECLLMGREYFNSDSNAIPFIVYDIEDEKYIFFGKNGTVHNANCVPRLMVDILKKLDTINDIELVYGIQENILNVYDKYFTSTFNWSPPTTMTVNGKTLSASKNYIADETIKWILDNENNPTIIIPLTSVYNTVFKIFEVGGANHVRGRFYELNIEKLNKRCCFIGLWEPTTNENYDFIVEKITEEYGEFTDFYYLDGTNKMVELKSSNETLQTDKLQDMKKQFFIHLMNQDEKRDALADFRRTRDEKNARKLGKMTQAEYNALRYVDENKKSNKRKIIFTETQIKHIIKENMNNELANYPQSFNMDTFKSLNSYNKKIKYCNDNLQRIASGSSRIVYKIDDATVLKLAKNQKGLAQNEAETLYRDDMYAPDIFAEVYDNDENFYWIEMQLAKKAKPTDFKRITGYDFQTFQYFVMYSAEENQIRTRRYGFSVPTEYKQLFNSEEFQDMMWENPDNVFYQIREYLTSYQIQNYGDVQRISSWGIVKDKYDGTDKLVLIDYGLTDDIAKKYYSKRR